MEERFGGGVVGVGGGEMMAENPPALERWLEVATKNLAEEGKTRVRAEIETHFEELAADSDAAGKSFDESGREAILSLGDPKRAHTGFKKVFLTEKEVAQLQKLTSRSIDSRRKVLFTCLSFIICGIPIAWSFLDSDKGSIAFVVLYFTILSLVLIDQTRRFLVDEAGKIKRSVFFFLNIFGPVVVISTWWTILVIHPDLEAPWLFLPLVLPYSYWLWGWWRIYRKLGSRCRFKVTSGETKGDGGIKV